MPGTSAGLNHSLDIHACGRSRMPRASKLFIQSAETILEPGAFDLNPQTAEALLEQLLIRQLLPSIFPTRHRHP